LSPLRSSQTPANGGTHTITGNFDLHGVKKSISFPATIQVSPDSVSANAEFSINRKDFGINYPGKADDLIRDGVVIKLTIQGSSQKVGVPAKKCLSEAVSHYHDLLNDRQLAEESLALLDQGFERAKLIFGGRRLSPYLRTALCQRG
jgi:hypothetical protein